MLVTNSWSRRWDETTITLRVADIDAEQGSLLLDPSGRVVNRTGVSGIPFFQPQILEVAPALGRLA